MYLVQIMNRRPQHTEFTKIIKIIRMFINSRDTEFMTREIQSFVNAEIVVSLKQQQIVEYLRKKLEDDIQESKHKTSYTIQTS